MSTPNVSALGKYCALGDPNGQQEDWQSGIWCDRFVKPQTPHSILLASVTDLHKKRRKTGFWRSYDDGPHVAGAH